MSCVIKDPVSVIDWPGRSPIFNFRAALTFTEIGMEREGFYSSIGPIKMLDRCVKHKKTNKASKKTADTEAFPTLF